MSPPTRDEVSGPTTSGETPTPTGPAETWTCWWDTACDACEWFMNVIAAGAVPEGTDVVTAGPAARSAAGAAGAGAWTASAAGVGAASCCADANTIGVGL